MNEQATGGGTACPPLLPQDGLPTRWLTDAERPYACGDSSLPVVIEPSRARDVRSLARRVADHSSAITATLAKHGAILFRGFDVRGDADFETLVTSIDAARPMAGYFMSEPGRHRIEGTRGVFNTNALYKTGGALYLGGLHSESFYSTDVPSLLAFWCKVAPRLGGETALVQAAKLYAALPPDLQQRLASDRVLAREFSIRDVAARYGVSAGAVEELFRELGLEVRDGDTGRTLALYKPTLIRHPTTERLAVQFNVSGEVPGFDAAFRRYAAPRYRGWPWLLHRAIWRWPALTSLVPALGSYPMFRQALSGLLEQAKERLRPRPAPEPPIRRGRVAERLTDDDVEVLARTAWQNLSVFTWRTGDVLILDQLQLLHMGMPGGGPRELHVILCNPIRIDWPLASGVLEPTPGERDYESLGSRLEALAKTGESDC